MLQNESFMEWKKNNDTKDCPKCGCTIQKFGGTSFDLFAVGVLRSKYIKRKTFPGAE